MTVPVISIIVALVAVAAALFLLLQVKQLRREQEQAQQERDQLATQQADTTAEADRLRERFQGVLDVDVKRKRVLDELTAERSKLEAAIATIRTKAQQESQAFQQQRQKLEQECSTVEGMVLRFRKELTALDEEMHLQSFGFYKPRYDFGSSEQYQAELTEIRGRQKRMLKDGTAAVCSTEWSVNGSRAVGQKQVEETLKLMLRAFNGECDAAVSKVRYNNVHVMENRIRKAFQTINAMTQSQHCSIAESFLDLKMEELHLLHEYQEKVQEEKEEQRRIREQMREEEIAQRELEKAKQDAEREEKRYQDALAKARAEAELAVGAKQQKLVSDIEELQRRLTEAQANKERALSRAQMTRSGHVYIISNVGSFGEHVYKIGMTRRLDPMDRIRELGDASVPFQFDVHAIIYAEDAPTLEASLHRLFAKRRVNRVNERKEFFRATIDEIAQAVVEHHGQIEIVKDAEAAEYRKTLAALDELTGNQPVHANGQAATQN